MKKRKPGLLGLEIGSESLECATQIAIDAVDGAAPQTVFACANMHSLVIATSDHAFNAALQNADILVADGVGVTVAGRVLGVDVGQRIAGEKFFSSVMGELQARGQGRVFFLGSSQRVLDSIAVQMKEKYPDVTLAGMYSPPFRSLTENDNREMVSFIAGCKPDILWVGMTAPKQEKWVYQNRALLNVKVIGSIGAVFDFFAKTRSAPPEWVRAMGVEAFYLLLKNPKRTWKRVFISFPRYIWLLVKYH